MPARMIDQLLGLFLSCQCLLASYGDIHVITVLMTGRLYDELAARCDIAQLSAFEHAAASVDLLPPTPQPRAHPPLPAITQCLSGEPVGQLILNPEFW
jgi:hypothetical protein